MTQPRHSAMGAKPKKLHPTRELAAWLCFVLSSSPLSVEIFSETTLGASSARLIRSFCWNDALKAYPGNKGNDESGGPQEVARPFGLVGPHKNFHETPVSAVDPDLQHQAADPPAHPTAVSAPLGCLRC